MSSAALRPYSLASALSCKAFELELRGHAERSENKLREALAAARAVGTEDCLVAAFLTVEASRHALGSLERQAREQLATPLNRPIFAAKLRECAEATTGAAAVARRRRAAGPAAGPAAGLTPRCGHLPAEQACFLAYHAAGMCAAKGCSQSEALEVVKFLPSLSSEISVYAACLALAILAFASELALFDADDISSRLDAACGLVDEAVKLAGRDRVSNTRSVYVGLLNKELHTGVEFWRQKKSTAARAALLAASLEQLSVYGRDARHVTARQKAQIDKETAETCAKIDAARAAASAPELLRSCALASCGAKEAHVSHFSRCGACKAVVYCSKDCQLADWPAHKKACKAARKAAEEAKSAAAGNAAASVER